MAATKNYHTGNGSTTEYSFTFPYLNLSDIKVKLDGVVTTAYTLKPANNPTIVNFTSAPANNVSILIYRDTAVETANAVHAAGSAITARSLNNNQTQTLYALEELENSIEKGDIYNYANASHSNGDSAPTSPNAGDTWFDTVSGRNYIYYTDTDTSQWVENSPSQTSWDIPVIYNNDVTFKGASYDAGWDKSENQFYHNDNAKASFGTAADLTIYHNGSNSILANKTGSFFINATATEVGIKVIPDAAVELYYNDSKKFETSSSGATLSGTLVADNLDIGTDVDVDGTLEADAYTVNGTALDEYIADTVGAMVSSNTETNITVTYQDADNTLDFSVTSITGNAATATALETARDIGGVSFDGTANINLPGVNTGGNQDTTGTATNATHVTVADNESTDENNLITFIENASATGNVGLESDGDFHYNPSSGTVTATIFKGDIDANDGDFDGTLEADAITVGGTALNTVIAGVTVTNATNAAHVSVADNESTDENNLITFIENASATGNVGLESDGDFHYNPSTGTVTATVFVGNLTGNASGTAATVTGAAQSAITSTGTLTGLTVSGDVFFDNGNDAGKDILWDVSEDALIFNDNVKAIFGSSSDGVEIYHDASNSYIKDNGTGSIITASNSWIYWMSEAADETIIKGGANSQGELYYDNVNRVATSSTGATITGVATVTSNILLGGELDFTGVADHYIDAYLNTVGNATKHSVYMRTVDSDHAHETAIKYTRDAGVELYYDNALKLETTDNGVTIHDSDITTHPGILKVDSATGASDQVYIGFTYGGSDTSNGGIRRDGTSQTPEFFAGSDRRIKKDIVNMPATLSKINQVQLKSFGYKDDATATGVGPIAQDLISVFPNKVTNTDDGTGDTVPDDVQPWTVGMNFTWELMKAVQELSAEVETLKTKVTALEGG